MAYPNEPTESHLPFDMTDVFRYMRENAVSRIDMSIETAPGEEAELAVTTSVLEHRDVDEVATVEASAMGLDFSFFIVSTTWGAE